MHLPNRVGAGSFGNTQCNLSELRQRLGERLQAIIHDDACHVLRYALKHKEHSQLSKDMAAMTWMLDRFHSKGHKDAWCASHCAPELFPEVAEGLNTSACEQVNALLGRHKYVYRQMTGPCRLFFLQEVIDSRNLLT